MDQEQNLGAIADASETETPHAGEAGIVVRAQKADLIPAGIIERLESYSALQPWHRQMRDWLGVHEVAGGAANPLIAAMHALTTLKATSDEVPWCSSAMCKALYDAGYNHTSSAAAVSWSRYGKPLGNLQVGAIVVLKREGGHHVGLAECWGEKIVWLIGGNQGDAVTVAPFNRARIVALRWPDSALNIKTRRQII